MANRPKSVYLTDRSMSALRPDDSLSGRMNAIVDRYLEMVARDGFDVRAQFAPKEWSILSSATGELPAGIPAAQQIAALHARVNLDDMTGGDLMVMLELLENERCATPTTHS